MLKLTNPRLGRKFNSIDSDDNEFIYLDLIMFNKAVIVNNYKNNLFLLKQENYNLEILNFEDGDSSPNLKIWVSSPLM